MEAGPLLPNYSSLTGAWVLDLSRSDTMAGHLRLLATPEAAIQTQMAGEQAQRSHNAITLNESRLAIVKSTAVRNSAETFKLNEEKISQTVAGVAKRSTASLLHDGLLTGYVVATSTTSPDGVDLLQQVESRWLEDGGHAHVQELSVRNNVTGAQCVTVRTWTRVPMTSSDLERLGRLLE
eukprot:g14712.t1